MLVAIVLLYVSPVKHWMTQSRTQAHQQEELNGLQHENAALKSRLKSLRAPGAIDREARRLGMVKQGERSFVLEQGR
jgi:cell division protein FtsB